MAAFKTESISLLSIPIAMPTPIGFLFANSYSEMAFILRLVDTLDLHICIAVFRELDGAWYNNLDGAVENYGSPLKTEFEN